MIDLIVKHLKISVLKKNHETENSAHAYSVEVLNSQNLID
jgi:hypothetical protein